MSERKLKAWQDAGLIDESVATRIREWEEQNSRPWGLWALVGLGALAVGLGLISVVAANWDEIAGEIRLGIHFALMSALTGYLWWRGPGKAGDTDFFHDALLFIAGALGLTFFGHIGQVYQTSSPLWQPLLAWLLLFTPLLLKYGRGWVAALMWFAAVIGTAWSHASEGQHWVGALIDGQVQARPGALYWGLIGGPPMIVVAIAAWLRGRSSRPDFWRRLEQLGLFAILIGASVTIIAGRGWGNSDGQSFAIAAIQAGLLGLAALAVLRARTSRSGQATAGILAAVALLLLVNVGAHIGSLIPALTFMGLWGAVAYGAIHAGWRMIFQLAVAVLALRLIILSFELADDLLGSGIGLIFAGLITLGTAWLAVRITKRYAPKQEAEA